MRQLQNDHHHPVAKESGRRTSLQRLRALLQAAQRKYCYRGPVDGPVLLCVATSWQQLHAVGCNKSRTEELNQSHGTGRSSSSLRDNRTNDTSQWRGLSGVRSDVRFPMCASGWPEGRSNKIYYPTAMQSRGRDRGNNDPFRGRPRCEGRLQENVTHSPHRSIPVCSLRNGTRKRLIFVCM